MKKFYLLILTAVLVMLGGAASAQVTYNSISPNPTNLTWANDRFLGWWSAPTEQLYSLYDQCLFRCNSGPCRRH